MANGVIGVYLIRCSGNGHLYVGSSKSIYRRWNEHRKRLRLGVHTCRYLQNSWKKYGESAFDFSILEKCSLEVLLDREQHFIDTLNPKLNVIREVMKWTPTQEMRDRNAAKSRARAALVTHCHRNHEYTEENTYRSKAGKRICRACNALRVASVYAGESPQDTERRRAKGREYFAANRAVRLANMKKYGATRKDAKREYDKAYRARVSSMNS